MVTMNPILEEDILKFIKSLFVEQENYNFFNDELRRKKIMFSSVPAESFSKDNIILSRFHVPYENKNIDFIEVKFLNHKRYEGFAFINQFNAQHAFKSFKNILSAIYLPM